ncbi:MAG: hypothetical protein PHN51_11600 [Candidatus Nanopelagicales bacterium]|nr:hypothetical protein [Candidatus Nanopelagicales bacterium]
MAKVSANYALANSAGYKFDIVKMGHHNYDQLAFYYKDDFPDVEVTRPDALVDMGRVHETCLVSVNGYVHSTVWSDNRFYIPFGTRSMLRSRQNSVGIVSLAGLSDTITKHPITSAMVFEDVGFSPYERVLITMPVAIEKPILIMAGYIVMENPEYFFRISDTTFVLRLDRLHYVEKLYELTTQRDIFRDLEVPVSDHNPTVVDGALIRSLGVIRKFLSTHNSFMVDLHTNGIQTQKVYTQHTTVPGTFRTGVRPVMPLFVGYGKLCEYKRVHDADGRHTVSVQDPTYSNHLFTQANIKATEVFNDHRKPGDRLRLSSAFFLDIYKET